MIIKLYLHVIGSSGLSIFASTNDLAPASVLGDGDKDGFFSGPPQNL